MDREGLKSHYEAEVEKSREYGHFYDFFLKTFIEEKKLNCFETFQNCSVTEIDRIMEIKRLLMVLNQLEEEIITIINTGKMAKVSLNQMEKENEPTN